MRSWLVVGLAALLIAAVALGGCVLGRRSVAPSGIAQTVQVDNLSVTMQIDDPVIGERTVDIAVKDAAGNPVDAQTVRLRFTMVEMDMGVVELDAQPLGRGRYQARGPFFTMVGDWNVDATVERAGQPAARATFAFPIAAPGEVSGSRNPLSPDAATLVAGRQLYADNCAACHGVAGKGDGPSAEGLNPRPADFSQHMIPGKHTDGQVFLWIRDGFPNSAMPAWKDRLSEQQIWQLVTYLRQAFGQAAQAQSTNPTPQPLPPVTLVDLRGRPRGAGPRLLTDELRSALEKLADELMVELSLDHETSLT